MRVLAARGTELEREFPFALVRQLFESELRTLDAGERDDLLAGAAEPAGPVIGLDESLRSAETREDPSFATLNALYCSPRTSAKPGPRSSPWTMSTGRTSRRCGSFDSSCRGWRTSPCCSC